MCFVCRCLLDFAGAGIPAMPAHVGVSHVVQASEWWALHSLLMMQVQASTCKYVRIHLISFDVPWCTMMYLCGLMKRYIIIDYHIISFHIISYHIYSYINICFTFFTCIYQYTPIFSKIWIYLDTLILFTVIYPYNPLIAILIPYDIIKVNNL